MYRGLHMKDVRINLGERSYVITVGPGAIERVGPSVASISKAKKALVVSNKLIAGHYAGLVLASLGGAGVETQLALIPSGERYKTLGTVQRIYQAMVEFRMDRRDALVALGGGVIGDMVGFAAAT